MHVQNNRYKKMQAHLKELELMEEDSISLKTPTVKNLKHRKNVINGRKH